MSRARRTALLSLAALSLTGSALAEPSLWARTKNPRAAAEAKLEGSLQRAFDEAEMSSLLGLGLNHRVLRRAAATFEGEGDPEDPELALLEARVLIGADIRREADARRLLESAIARLPDGTRAASAWNALAMALARFDDPPAEELAYTRVIELTWDSESRALAYYNRAEVVMRRRDIPRALVDYQKAADLAQDPSTIAISRYGLAVAQERLGDLPAAYASLDRASFVHLPVPPFAAEDPLDLPGLYFVPSYEENYLRALRAMAAGRRATDPAERHDAYEIAVAEWDLYLELTPENEPFRENARLHRARSARELDRPQPKKH